MMNYLATFLTGMWFIAFTSLFVFLIKPNWWGVSTKKLNCHFTRWQIFGRWFGYCILGLILIAVIIPDDANPNNTEDIPLFFAGCIVQIIIFVLMAIRVRNLPKPPNNGGLSAWWQRQMAEAERIQAEKQQRQEAERQEKIRLKELEIRQKELEIKEKELELKRQEQFRKDAEYTQKLLNRDRPSYDSYKNFDDDFDDFDDDFDDDDDSDFGAQPVVYKFDKRPYLHIVYRDAKGDTTERDIVVFDFSTSKDRSLGYLNALCKLRDQKRQFRIDRIVSAVDLEDGEKYDGVAQVIVLLQSKMT